MNRGIAILGKVRADHQSKVRHYHRDNPQYFTATTQREAANTPNLSIKMFMPKHRYLKTPTMRFLEAVDPQKRSIQQIMLDAFRQTGTELAAAKLMGVTQQSYNSWKYRLNLAEAIFRISRGLDENGATAEDLPDERSQ